MRGALDSRLLASTATLNILNAVLIFPLHKSRNTNHLDHVWNSLFLNGGERSIAEQQTCVARCTCFRATSAALTLIFPWRNAGHHRFQNLGRFTDTTIEVHHFVHHGV